MCHYNGRDVTSVLLDYPTIERPRIAMIAGFGTAGLIMALAILAYLYMKVSKKRSTSVVEAPAEAELKPMVSSWFLSRSRFVLLNNAVISLFYFGLIHFSSSFWMISSRWSTTPMNFASVWKRQLKTRILRWRKICQLGLVSHSVDCTL